MLPLWLSIATALTKNSFHWGIQNCLL